MLCVFFLGSFCANHTAAHAQTAGNPLAGLTGEDAAQGSIDAATFRFNDRYTTPFGPAYADIWLVQSDFLTCRPPVGRPFTTDDLMLFSDLARHGSLAIDNARLYFESQQAVRAREEVLAIVSHDLRNPLNAVTLGASPRAPVAASACPAPRPASPR